MPTLIILLLQILHLLDFFAAPDALSVYIEDLLYVVRKANSYSAKLQIKYEIKMNRAVNSSSADRFRLGLDLAAHNPQALPSGSAKVSYVCFR